MAVQFASFDLLFSMIYMIKQLPVTIHDASLSNNINRFYFTFHVNVVNSDFVRVVHDNMGV